MTDTCSLCGQASFESVVGHVRDDETRGVRRCESCGHLQVLPRPTAEEDRAFYDANSQDLARGKEIDYEKLRGNNAYDTDRHVRLIESLGASREARVLDVGAGYGFFANALADAGFSAVTGFEISRDRRTLGNERGSVELLEVDAAEPGEHAGAYDVVTCFHVVEHTADPVSFVAALARLVAPGGTLVLEVPNAREMMLETVPAYFDFYWIRAHLNYFTAETLTRCVREAGLPEPEIRFEQRYGIENLSAWLATGKPQIDRPTFETQGAYRPLEEQYRAWLVEQGRTDAVIAIVRMP